MISRVRVPLFVGALLAAAGLAGLMVTRPTDGSPAPLSGTILTGRTAPGIALHDQFGHGVTLRQFRGHPVIVTFLAANCTQLCPVVAETIHRTMIELGPAGRSVGILAVSTEPEADTHSLVARFSREHGLLHRWHYLSGPRSAVRPVWKEYAIYAPPANATQAEVNGHTSATYLIDSSGKERVLVTSDPGTGLLSRDLRILLGLPVTGGLADDVPAPQPGHQAPAFALHSLSSSTVQLSAERGHPVLLNFWATWCTACKSEMPALVRWSRRLRSEGLVVLGIDQGDPRKDVASFVRRYRVTYPILLDSDGAISGKYEVIGLPTSYLIGPDGVVEMARPGALGVNDLRDLERRVREDRGG